MAMEREKQKKLTLEREKHLSYTAAEPNAQLVFLAQPEHGQRSPAGVAFAALMLPTLRDGLPSHWLSDESVNSLQRWCDQEGMPLQTLKGVVGRVVQIAGPFVVPKSGGGRAGGGGDGRGELAPDNYYNLPAGESYYVVHAEMKLQHRWTTA